jgi:uncharacterized 2Fe-2S/4Fe-4S cluster protein (DUF4445 family)
VDAVAELVRLGLLDQSGRLIPEEDAALASRRDWLGRLTQLGKERVFVLHWLGEPGDVSQSIYLSQRDVRELQFAKAAIATGWDILLEEAGLQPGTSSRCCWPARSAATCRRPTRSGSGWCRGCRCCGW